MARVLVTGGSGFIGSHVVDALLKNKHTVVVLDDLSNGNYISKRTAFHKADIRDKDKVIEFSKACDVIFHLAAQVSVPRSFEDPKENDDINVQGTKNIIAAAKKNKVQKIIFSSSCAVYGDNKDLPLKESSKVNPLSPYAKSKLAGEVLLKRSKIPFVAFRYFNVFGIRQSPRSQYAAAIPIFVDKALSDKPITIFGTGLQTRDFVNVSDVAKANVMAMNRGQGVYNICTGKAIDVNCLARKIVNISKSASKVTHENPRAGEILHSLGSFENARKFLGWSPKITLEKGLKEYVEWVRL